MTERSVQHATFIIERTFEFTPAEVFGAFSAAEAKNRWLFAPDEEAKDGDEFDFSVGGRDHFVVKLEEGHVNSYDARYYDIVPNQRIVYCYEMYVNRARISVSVATIELAPVDAGTRLTFTEQGAFLDGEDAKAREDGTAFVIDDFGRALREMLS
jgi:uncharacterized protein YndB with AHSA1/START domain